MKKIYFSIVFIFSVLHINAQDPFITDWDVLGSDLTITIPTQGTGYNYTVDFDDGTVLTNQTGDVTHTYSNPGFYKVKITGDFPRIYFGGSTSSNADKLFAVLEWGDIEWESMEGAFENCIDLFIIASDSPDLSQVTNMSKMFKGCSIIGDLNTWDVSNITDMSELFNGGGVTNLEDWDVSNVTNMSYMFAGSYFNNDISDWDVSSVTNMSHMFFENYQFNQPIDNWDVSNVTDMSGMFKETSNNSGFEQPLNNWDVSSVTDMSEMFRGSSFNEDISSWDVSNVTDMKMMFSEDHFFNQPIGDWDVSNVTDISYMFGNFSGNFNQNINDWDVSNVTDMEGVFVGARDFNHPLDNWDVSNVTTMAKMFYRAESFNQNIDDWDVANVTDMSEMFLDAENFDQPLNSWNVSAVENMSQMFDRADTFNQPLNNWDVSNVTNMSAMFKTAIYFNQTIEDWDVSAVEDMEEMFQNAEAFNQPLDNWDVSNVTDMSSMFKTAASFNQPLEDWDVSAVEDMKEMFQNAADFNQPLNNWDVSNVENMKQMFESAYTFNQPLDNWNVYNVMHMYSMFQNASDFNQDLSSWNFNVGVRLHRGLSGFNFISYSGLDVVNYEALLFHLASLTLQEDELGAHDLEYCDETARDQLIDDGWSIYGDDVSDDCNTLSGSILYDENNNGCNSNDIAVSNFMLHADGGNTSYSTFCEDGSYNLSTIGSSFTVSLPNLPSYFSASPASETVNFTSSNTETVDFCLTANQSAEDLNIVIVPTNQARPGYDATYQLIVQNVGTETLTNTEATVDFDDTMQDFISADPTPDNTTSTQLTFDTGTIQPFETKTMDFVMNTLPPPTVNGNDTLVFSTTITPNANDFTPADNTFDFDQIVVNSFDPNDKQVLQGEEIYLDQADEYLHYLIRFQNTGTASAINVRILDTLHPKLDWNTIQPLSASHEYHVEITDGNQVEFIFEDIDLPHEDADEAGSNGFIAYKIKPKSDVEIGDIFSGDARIYFDFNAPIITNMVATEIVEDPVYAPEADFTASETEVATNQPVTFTDLSTNAPDSWEWSFEGGTPSVSSEESPSITYAEAGVYSVSLTSSNAAGEDTETKTAYIHVNDLGVTDFLKDNIHLYPNPTNNQINLNISDGIEVEEITLYNPQGQIVKRFTSKTNLIKVEDITSGVYLIKISTDKGTLTRQVIKE